MVGSVRLSGHLRLGRVLDHHPAELDGQPPMQR
jgi:hypothetical protein